MRKLLLPIIFLLQYSLFPQAGEIQKLKIDNPILSKGNKQYEIKYTQDVYFLGWSKDGKIALILGNNSPYPSYNMIFNIYDLISDKIEYSSDYWDPIQLEIENDIDFKKQSKESWASIFYRENKKTVDDVLSKYKIVYSNKTDILKPLPIKLNKKMYSLSDNVTIYETGGENIITNSSYKLSISDGKKTISLFDSISPFSYFFEIEPIGYIESPFENRIAIVLVIHSWQIENDNSNYFHFIGCGFNSAF